MPAQNIPESLFACFADLPDPRRGNAIRHQLLDIVVIAVLAIIAGADDWDEIEAFAEAKQPWLATILALPNGIPSHDTFERVFARLDPNHMHTCFTQWIGLVCTCLEAQVIAIDGKAARGSFDRATGHQAIRVVRAWATEQRLVLAEGTVDKKSNEIPAIKALLEILEIRGCTVTLDAMGCQKEIAAA